MTINNVEKENYEDRYNSILAYEDDIKSGKVIAAIWTTDDVMSQAENSSVELTEEEAIEVLQKIDHGHDAEIGINWEVIDAHLDMFVADKKKTEEASVKAPSL